MATNPFNARLAIEGDNWNSDGGRNGEGEFGLRLSNDKSSV